MMQPSQKEWVKDSAQLIVEGLEKNGIQISKDTQFEVLEVLSLLVSGFSKEDVAASIGFHPNNEVYIHVASQVFTFWGTCPFYKSLLLSSLAELESDENIQRTNGVYFSDFRLAMFLAQELEYSEGFTLLDPACGSGILLVASAIHLHEQYKIDLETLLRQCIFGADISEIAVRGAILSLSSLTKSVVTIDCIRRNIRRADSVIHQHETWADLRHDGFSCVIANPPWEKLSLNKYEIAKSLGIVKHYGGELQPTELARIERSKDNAKSLYSAVIKERYHLQGSGENDLYKLFVELIFRLTKVQGKISVLVPAGIIRSKGTEQLREALFNNFCDIKIAVFDNRPGFFKIDSRFKFVRIVAVKHKIKNGQIKLTFPVATQSAISEVSKSTNISLSFLRKNYDHLIVPEVNGNAWEVLRKIIKYGVKLGSVGCVWKPIYSREIDMTSDKHKFVRAIERTNQKVPVIEGRMVAQYSSSAKKYISGQGRTAVWVSNNFGAEYQPQYYFNEEFITERIQNFITSPRIGFCDISGQTNERTMLAAYIPTGVICGNKVPTVRFDLVSEDVSFAWLAIANSFAFDWVLRRIVTTTVNYFLLLNTFFPDIKPSSSEAKSLSLYAKKLTFETLTSMQKAEIRLEIDLLVFSLFRLSVMEVEEILKDFNGLDRSQNFIAGEQRSTITKDFILFHYSKMVENINSNVVHSLHNRYELSLSTGAIPYLSSTL